MSRSRDLVRFFWEQTSSALQLRDVHTSEKGWGTPREIQIMGRASGFDIAAGTYWEGSGQSSVQYAFAAVPLSDLPYGLAVDGRVGRSPVERVEVACENGRVRVVTLSSMPVELEGLRLEQLSVHLKEFLTTRRREVICSMQADLLWLEGGHQLVRRIAGDAYPRKRILARAMAGESRAMHTMWEYRDRMVALVKGTLDDAKIAALELRA